MDKHHGGQNWRMKNFKADFSVTTNALGTPISGINTIKKYINDLDHYPNINNEPCITLLSNFYNIDKKYLILGNGSSELIDLVIRKLKCKTSNLGPYHIQYKDYERVCKLYNIRKVDKNPDITIIVNPCNPMGKFMKKKELKEYIKNHPSKNYIIDESMIFWYGENWKSESLLSERKFCLDNNIYLIHSLTKIWCCCGIRIGSLTCPGDTTKFKNSLVPWNVNFISQIFLQEVINDKQYLKDTWFYTKKWRKSFCDFIKIKFPKWDIYGEEFNSFILINTHNEDIAKKCYEECLKNGVPIRWLKNGYNFPTYIRIAVRKPEFQEVVKKSLLNC